MIGCDPGTEGRMRQVDARRVVQRHTPWKTPKKTPPTTLSPRAEPEASDIVMRWRAEWRPQPASTTGRGYEVWKRGGGVAPAGLWASSRTVLQGRARASHPGSSTRPLCLGAWFCLSFLVSCLVVSCPPQALCSRSAHRPCCLIFPSSPLLAPQWSSRVSAPRPASWASCLGSRAHRDERRGRRRRKKKKKKKKKNEAKKRQKKEWQSDTKRYALSA